MRYQESFELLSGQWSQDGLSPHTYADDTQVCGSCRPAAVGPSRRRSSSMSALLPAGWSLTDCHWTATKRKLYDVLLQLCQLTALWLSPPPSNSIWPHLSYGLVRSMCQCFDTVGWVIRPVKTVGRITYIVLVQTLNPAQSINLVKPVRSARDLGIYIDADLVMRTHVQRTVSRSSASCVRSVRPGMTSQKMCIRIIGHILSPPQDTGSLFMITY